MCLKGVITHPMMFAGGMYENSASDLTIDLHLMSVRFHGERHSLCLHRIDSENKLMLLISILDNSHERVRQDSNQDRHNKEVTNDQE